MRAMNQSQLDMRDDSVTKLREAEAALVDFARDLAATHTFVDKSITLMAYECKKSADMLENLKVRNGTPLGGW
tara:strand:- start:41 stop:259 length:219 start_codon:yes stop_codon:yes gene_type:complete